MKIGILANKNKVKDENSILEITEFLQSNGHSIVRFLSPSEIDGVDVLIVLGGDGAILHSAVISARKNIKIIGINYGTLGFLTEYEKNERELIQELLSQLEKEECKILKRSIIEIEVLGQTFYALNEIALQRDNGLRATKNSQILKLYVETKSGSDIIAGDGVLFCTPTGSTAYSLSAGGAILVPEVPVFMMTPICAFSMRARPIVFADSEEITVRIGRGNSILLCDGVTIAKLPEGTMIRIKKAPFTADFPVRDESDFFAKVRNKLNT